MTLRQLQFARAVAECRSFSRAAKACHATQPTLSNAISQLEEDLGGRLFTRTTRKVELTPFGAYLLPFLNAVLDARGELEKAAEAFHHPVHKLLRIGFSPLVDGKLLNRVLEPYRQRHPDISIFFKECLLDDLSERLANGTIDIAIVPETGEETPFERFSFYSDELVYLPRDDGNRPPLAGPLLFSGLPDVPVIMTGGGCGLNGTLTSLAERQGARLRTYPGEAVSYQVIEEWAALGIGAGILPRAKLSAGVSRGVALLTNDGRPAVFSFQWIWNRTAPSRSHLAEYIDYVRATVPALVSGMEHQPRRLA